MSAYAGCGRLQGEKNRGVTLTETKLHDLGLTAEADARARRAQERVGEAHPEDANSPGKERTVSKHFDSSYQTMLFGGAGT